MAINDNNALSSNHYHRTSSEEYYRNFKNSCKTIATFESYNSKLNKYMKYRGYTEYSQLVDPNKDIRIRHYRFYSLFERETLPISVKMCLPECDLSFL